MSTPAALDVWEHARPTANKEPDMTQAPTLWPVLTVPVSDRDHAQGPATAEVTLVEYGEHRASDFGRKRLRRRPKPRIVVLH